MARGGGSLIAVRKHLQAAPLASSRPVPGVGYLCKEWKLATLSVRLHKMEVLLMSGYARLGCMSTLLQNVASVSLNGRFPFVLVGGMSKDPQEVRKSHMLEHLRATIVTPHDAYNACEQGQGSLIDHVIVSKSLAAYVSVEGLPIVPWDTHWGLNVSIGANANLVRKAVMATPMRRSPTRDLLSHAPSIGTRLQLLPIVLMAQ